MSKDEVSVKLMTIGDGAVGKTSLLISYAQNKFPDTYIPTVFDNYTCTMMYKNQPVNLALWDTAGQSDYDILRPLAYPGTHVFLICFSVVSRTSFFNVNQKWIGEMKHHCPDVPFILCGTKADLLNDKELITKLEQTNQLPIYKKEGDEKAKKLGAYGYVECSGKTQKGMKEVFELCAEAGLVKQGVIQQQAPKKKESKECIVL